MIANFTDYLCRCCISFTIRDTLNEATQYLVLLPDMRSNKYYARSMYVTASERKSNRTVDNRKNTKIDSAFPLASNNVSVEISIEFIVFTGRVAGTRLRCKQKKRDI